MGSAHTKEREHKAPFYLYLSGNKYNLNSGAICPTLEKNTRTRVFCDDSHVVAVMMQISFVFYCIIDFL